MKNKTKKKIILGIIIPVFNHLDYTKQCLESLHEIITAAGLDERNVKIILVDDGSTDGTGEWVAMHHPEVIILPGDGNLWWSGSMNFGIQHALDNLECNYILWWNNDIKPQQDYLSCLWTKIQNNPENIIIGSKIYAGQTGQVWSMGGYFNPVTGIKEMYGFMKQDGQEYHNPIEADWFPGMGTCMHRSVFNQTGLLNSLNFPQYHGDSDFTYRAKLKGYRLIAYPDLVLYNDITNTGIQHQGNIKFLYQTLFGIKSNYNIRKDLKFYRLYATSPRAYKTLFIKYFRYIGGFIKWKILGWFRKKKPENP